MKTVFRLSRLTKPDPIVKALERHRARQILKQINTDSLWGPLDGSCADRKVRKPVVRAGK